jgi:bifunctional ADP-heptose synthase (sugar kinase/adenylyltransferase)
MQKAPQSRVELIAASRAAGVPVLVDPKGTDFKRYRARCVDTESRRV